jgi:4-amino-4-deoxy-L-arabinose transferase-like glycosyltransferase
MPPTKPKPKSKSAKKETPAKDPDRKWLLIIIATAFLLRLGYIVVFQTYRFPSGDKYIFGYETGAIARSIASGHGFSSPFRTVSGPSAWLAPLYPLLVAGVFKVWGIYSDASAFVIFTVNSIFSAVTCLPLYLVARRLFNRRIALVSAWIWALAPPAMFWATNWVWETALSALLLTWLIWITLTLTDSESIGPWLLFGLAWGIAALTNPSLLSFFPISLAYPLWMRRSRDQPWGSRAAVTLLLFVNLITPWLLRNFEVFHYPVFIRPNLWAEISFGNGEGADGTWQSKVHPSMNPRENAAYDLMGEVQYVQWKKIQVTEFISQHPGRFASLCLRRIYLFWSGYSRPGEGLRWLKAACWLAFTLLAFVGTLLALRRAIAGAVPITLLLLLYPMAYYISFAFSRYKHPIEPIMTAMAVFAASSILKGRDVA